MLQLRSKDRRNGAHLARRTRTVLVQKKVFGERAGAAAAILNIHARKRLTMTRNNSVLISSPPVRKRGKPRPIHSRNA